MNRDSEDHFDHGPRPTTEQPLGGPKRGPWKPLLVTILVFAVLAGLYLLAAQFVLDAG